MSASWNHFKCECDVVWHLHCNLLFDIWCYCLFFFNLMTYTPWWYNFLTVLNFMVRKGHNLAVAQNKIKWSKFLLGGCPMPSSLCFFLSLWKYNQHWRILKHSWGRSSYSFKTYEIVRTRFVSVRQSCKIILQQLYNKIHILLNIVFW